MNNSTTQSNNTPQPKKHRYRLNKRKLAGFITVVCFMAAVITLAVFVSAQTQPAIAVQLTNHNAGQSAHSDHPANTNDLSGITVLIDPGHGGFDPGAIGAADSYESNVNLDVAKKLKTEFEFFGMNVIMTREDDSGLGTTQTESLHERRRIIEETRPDIVISIHMNSYSDTSVSGPLVLFSPGSVKGRDFARAVQRELNDALGAGGRARSQDLYVLQSGPQPSILVECGYISNPKEEEKLLSDEYQKTVAKAICDGTADFLLNQS